MSGYYFLFRCSVLKTNQRWSSCTAMNIVPTSKRTGITRCSWPGLVGMLNLNGSLTKAGVEYSTLWSENFKDAFFRDALSQRGSTGWTAP